MGRLLFQQSGWFLVRVVADNLKTGWSQPITADTIINARAIGNYFLSHALIAFDLMGADPTSRIFYNRVKGEMEIAVMQLGYETVVIAQPSLLLGDRAALGQPTRTSEKWAGRLLAPLGWIMPKGVRPIPASTVASALLAAILDAKPGVRVVKSGAMQSSPGSETTFAA